MRPLKRKSSISIDSDLLEKLREKSRRGLPSIVSVY